MLSTLTRVVRRWLGLPHPGNPDYPIPHAGVLLAWWSWRRARAAARNKALSRLDRATLRLMARGYRRECANRLGVWAWRTGSVLLVGALWFLAGVLIGRQS